MNIEICQTDLFNPALMTLIAQLDAYQLPRYPAESNYADPVEVMLQVKTLYILLTLTIRPLDAPHLFCQKADIRK